MSARAVLSIVVFATVVVGIPAARAKDPSPKPPVSFVAQVMPVLDRAGEWSVRMRQSTNARSNRALYPGGMPQAILWALKTWRLYVACGDSTIKVMQTNGRVQATCKGHTDWVYSLALSPESTKFASGSDDGTVRLWGASRGLPLATFVQFAPGSDEWLVMTAPGYLATSSLGALKFKPTAKGVAVDKLLPVLQNPRTVAKVLAEAKPKATPRGKPKPKPKTPKKK